MKLIYISSIFVLILTLSSCHDLFPLECAHNYFYIKNDLNKEIIYIQVVDDYEIDDDTLFYYVNGVSDMSLAWHVYGKTASSQHSPIIGFENFYLYNISDTMSFVGRFYEDDRKRKDFFYGSYGNSYKDDEQNIVNTVYNTYLTFNDSLLKRMKKDYSMLDKFKEYYQK
jgi:hypothetical protein